MFSVKVNGASLDTFTEINVKSIMNAVAREFSMTMTSSLLKDYPVKVGAKIEISLHNELILTGLIEKMDWSYNNSEHVITAVGRSKTLVLIKSSVVKRTFNKPIRLTTLFNKVIRDIGSDLKVINNSGVNPSFKENVDAEVGESCFSFLSRYCKKAQVIMSCDGAGNVVLMRGETKYEDKIIQHVKNKQDNNVLECKGSLDNSQRYRKYIVMTQPPEDDDLSNESQAGQEGIAYDTYMTNGLVKVIVSDTDTNLETVKERAFWEANIRRAHSNKFTYVVQGYKDNTDELYKINTRVNIVDDFSDMNGIMLINSVSYSMGSNTTSIELLPPDAYTLEASRSKLDEIDSDRSETLKSQL